MAWMPVGARIAAKTSHLAVLLSMMACSLVASSVAWFIWYQQIAKAYPFRRWLARQTKMAIALRITTAPSSATGSLLRAGGTARMLTGVYSFMETSVDEVLHILRIQAEAACRMEITQGTLAKAELLALQAGASPWQVEHVKRVAYAKGRAARQTRGCSTC